MSISQQEIEERINRAREILNHPDIEHFIIAEGKGVGASSTRSTNKKSASHNARRYHKKWERRNRIDPKHQRDDRVGL